MRFFPDSLFQGRFCIFMQHQGRKDRGSLDPGLYRLVQRRFQALVADCEYHVLHRLGQSGQGRVARHAVDLIVTRVDGIQQARKFSFQQVFQHRVADRVLAPARADYGNAVGSHQWVKKMRHESYRGKRVRFEI